MNRKAFDAELREIIQDDNSLIELADGQVWKVKNREMLWDKLGSRLYDKDIEAAKELAVKVLSERNPKFELSPDKRFYANLQGKGLRYSAEIRENQAETLALLGNRYEVLSNCTPGKPQAAAALAVREILADADWHLWGTLNHLLPTLAEAAPKEFIRAVESALADPAGPFDELFRQESEGAFGGDNYLTGLLWGLEALAWDQDLLAKVCVVLAELAEHDPGGNWSNRPGSSISTILLPWYPQTFAPIDKRFAAMRAIIKDSPDVGWRVLLELLPHGMGTTSGTHKAKWRNPVPDDWEPNVTGAEHFAQIEQYAFMALKLASEDFSRLLELVGILDNLPKNPFEAALELLSSAETSSLDDDQKSELWRELTKFTNKHRRFTDAKWALPAEQVEHLEAIAAQLQPDDPRLLHKRLFSSDDFDLYEEKDSYEEEQWKLLDKRIRAIGEIIELGGLEAVLEFTKTVESPYQVGCATAKLSNSELDKEILPALLNASDDAITGFVANYSFWRFLDAGEPWLDGLDRAEWELSQSCALLKSLPFDQPIWTRVDAWLGEAAASYWREVAVNPYQAESGLEHAISRLLDAGRPHTAIDCLYCQRHKTKSFDAAQAVRALQDALSVKEVVGNLGQHHFIDLITALQQDESVPEKDMISIEWGYLRLLQRGNNVAPRLLMSKLATEPEFFCEAIRLIYKSRNEDVQPDEAEGVDESRKRIAENVWHLLYEWNKPPGSSIGQEFNGEAFASWLERVQQISRETGHFEVSMIKVGEVLYHTPEDADGFWINRVVADCLNVRGADEMRRGFRTQIFNARGVHWVDPTGAPERQLAEDWRNKANATEQEGFARFADTLRDAATSYDQEAERIVREHADRE